jgi:hypothetical protein
LIDRPTRSAVADEAVDLSEDLSRVGAADDVLDFGEEFGSIKFVDAGDDAADVAAPVIKKPEIITPADMTRTADDVDPMRTADFGIDRETGELGKPKSSRLRFGRKSKPEPVSVGTPADDIPTRVEPRTSGNLRGRLLGGAKSATAADATEAGVEASVVSAAREGTAVADDVVSSGASRVSTAVGGLKPRSAGGVLGLGLALAAGGAGVIYMSKRRGKPEYEGY